MDFADGFAGLMGLAILAAVQAAHRLFPDDLGPLLCLTVDLDPIGTVDLVIGEDAILKDEPPGPPPLAVIDPFMEDPGDPIADDIINLHLSVVPAVKEGALP